jgi:predicted dehydrogenase
MASTPRRDLTGRRLRVGIVGGGRGAFIGAVHRAAVELDGEALVVAGALSADPQTARESAAAWYLARSYDSYEQMAREEAMREDGIDFVIIATPNHLHCPVASAFLSAGIAVVCDKPLALDVAEAQALAGLVERAGLPFAVTYTYSGYPAVREARERVALGLVGEVRKVLVEYHQGWLMSPLEQAGNKQAAWRTDPVRAGAGGCIGDIGTHALHLLEYVTGLEVEALCADLTSFVAERTLDDDANVLLRLAGGGKGVLSCSQVACGEYNNLVLRIYGERAGLEWHQETPNTLTFKPADQPWEQIQVNGWGMSGAARAATRLPAGHPEGYYEAFAVLYRQFIADLRRVAQGARPLGGYPSVADGVRGMRFVARAIESSRAGGCWLTL